MNSEMAHQADFIFERGPIDGTWRVIKSRTTSNGIIVTAKRAKQMVNEASIILNKNPIVMYR